MRKGIDRLGWGQNCALGQGKKEMTNQKRVAWSVPKCNILLPNPT